jgi:hypothetical protein
VRAEPLTFALGSLTVNGLLLDAVSPTSHLSRVLCAGCKNQSCGNFWLALMRPLLHICGGLWPLESWVQWEMVPIRCDCEPIDVSGCRLSHQIGWTLADGTPFRVVLVHFWVVGRRVDCGGGAMKRLVFREKVDPYAFLLRVLFQVSDGKVISLLRQAEESFLCHFGTKKRRRRLQTSDSETRPFVLSTCMKKIGRHLGVVGQSD